LLSIIIPTCTDSLLSSLLMTLKVSSPEPTYQVIVADNGLSAATRKRYPDVVFVEVPDPFCFSRAVNLAAANATPGSDVCLINDDVVIQSERFVESMERALIKAKAEGFGVISPITAGGVGNQDQTWEVRPDEIWLTRITLCFVCVAIPRAVWDEVGGMDEDYIWYGFEDNSFCRCVVDAGWKLGVTGAAKVKHGNGAIPHSTTYKRKFNPGELDAISIKAREVFQQKWGYGPRLGDYDLGGPAVDRVIVDDQDQIPTQSLVLDNGKAVSGKQSKPFTPRPTGAAPSLLAGLEAWELTRERLVELAGPIPERIFALGKDQDIESDVDVLWAIVKLLKPRVSVELGTRHGVATRVLADALADVPDRKFYTVDHPAYRDSVVGVDCEFVPKAAFYENWNRAIPIDLLLVDTDPHDRQQTQMHLEWIEKVLAPGGCALFHDIVQNRPEIQVKEAVREFVATRTNWIFIEFPLQDMIYKWPQGGLGLLIRP
jgi:GT2 family glycosyltransferase/predicted O-methyltransferase YrrM